MVLGGGVEMPSKRVVDGGARGDSDDGYGNERSVVFLSGFQIRVLLADFVDATAKLVAALAAFKVIEELADPTFESLHGPLGGGAET